MRIIADFHVHSAYSRATSPSMNPVEICGWADKKGISVIATGDFQHPAYFGVLKNKLVEAEPGLYKVKKSSYKSRMILSTETSHIYKQGGKVRKVHMLVVMPDMSAAEKFSKKLATLGNTGSDGRPIFGFSAKDLVKISLDIAPDAMVIPAHIWTPWFSVFGSKSGFNSLEECFEEQVKYIHAVETGLSSDAAMNWRVSELDKVALISNSDAHSPRKIGREANVLDCDLSYKSIKQAVEKKDRKKFLYTIEFFPEEGKYHNDGHRLCGINYHPRESLAKKNRCPVCFKPLVLGVLHRVEELADRPWDYIPKNAIPQKHIIPLEEIIADVKEVSASSKKVAEAYEKMIVKGGPEFEILLDRTPEELKNICDEKTAQAIMLVREEKVNLVPGFDGEFGKISIFRKLDNAVPRPGKLQMDLFE
ncbi:MAG TPA: endonuclease Q family protein [Candidatus Goldiibacteriota bacterium]|nr:endonuclease Q family protein [Candidatus Goldiibacteriota bacterium]HPI03187.1 endonuclease Q family protein [Candidatus Goldiibacteriota bacterium]HPN64261.1 endonuclease Q family protein [Candidatus Goldiibacteriota bacterium]HRQ44456.1 endonuclease Q family protein [Candidatus Goldiibacteriota bacterium]